MSNIDVSIIVPVYRVEKYLRRCLVSILEQSNNNIEVIVIDDGSPDGCPGICDEYALLDSRVKVVHQKNNGLSCSRNIGIDLANGEYLMFVDSDDFITKNAVEKLLENAKKYNLDVSYGNYKNINRSDTNSKLFHGQNCQLFNGNEFIKEQLKAGKLHIAVWLGMYRREFIVQNKIYFENGIVHEDERWSPLVLLSAKRIRCIADGFYCYNNENPESITRRKNREQNGLDIIKTCYYLEGKFEGLKDARLKKYLMDHIARLYIFAVIDCNLNTKKYTARLNSRFLIRKAYFFKTRIKVFVFIISKSFYKYYYNKRKKRWSS